MADEESHMQQSSDKTDVKFKYTTFTETFSDISSENKDIISLQEAFRIYREAKQDDIRRERLIRKRRELRKANPEKMAALRQKFVEQAKKYYGYPYAKKYWPPDSPEYKSKLFLDCCGLVRKVMRDLADDFGFIIGPWNQAYMYDTLPITVDKERDMKPGDLVFVSAIYYNPKSKKQRHNMTHVEIWAGEGKKTIGARWNNGKVQLFDSYKFAAKSYHSEVYHFKSIDTWLTGICKSHCSEHRWRRAKYNPKKKSIFAVPEQIEEDEAAGDDDDNVDTYNVRGKTFCEQVDSVSRMVSQCKKEMMKRPKTDMDIPNLTSSASADSLDSKMSPSPFPSIRNDLEKKSSVKQKGAKRDTSRNRDRMNSNAEGKSAQEASIGMGKLSLEGDLSEIGKKGVYLKDIVDAQRKTRGGTAFVVGGDDDEDDDDNDDDYGDDGEGSDDDMYKDDEISDEELENVCEPESDQYLEKIAGNAEQIDRPNLANDANTSNGKAEKEKVDNESFDEQRAGDRERGDKEDIGKNETQIADNVKDTSIAESEEGSGTSLNKEIKDDTSVEKNASDVETVAQPAESEADLNINQNAMPKNSKADGKETGASKRQYPIQRSNTPARMALEVASVSLQHKQAESGTSGVGSNASSSGPNSRASSRASNGSGGQGAGPSDSGVSVLRSGSMENNKSSGSNGARAKKQGTGSTQGGV